jgi:hypothetical protein
MEEEVRVLLRQNFLAPEQVKTQPFGQAMRALFAPLNGVGNLELDIPARAREQ